MPRYSAEQIYAYALQAGFDPHSATTMTAVAMAESRGSSDAHATHGEDSRGLWQINARAHPDLAQRYDLWNPADNARAAFEISRGGADVSPWTTTHGGTRASYVRFRHDAQAAAVAHGDQPGLGVWTGTRGYGHALAASPDLRGSHQHPTPTPAASTDDATALHGAGTGAGVEGAGTAGDVSGLHVDVAPSAAAVEAHAPAPVTTDPAHPGDPGAVPSAAEHLLAQQTVVTAVVPVDDKDVASAAAPTIAAAPAPASGAEPPLAVPVAPGDLPEHPGLVTHLTAEQLVRLDQPPAPVTVAHPVQQAAVVPHPLAVVDPVTAAPVVPEVAHEPAHAAHDSQALDRFLEVAAAQKGDAYVMGAQARLSDPNPSVFDCAELVRWSAHQAGVNLPDGSWLQYLHLKEAGAIIPVEQAVHTPGALLFAFSSEPTPGGGRPSHSHVAISDGHGHTIEARGRAYGVGSWDVKHRFSYAAVIPGLDGAAPQTQHAPQPAPQPAPPHDGGHGGGGHASGGLTLDAAPAPAALGGALIDTDGDGLADELERSLGLDPHHADTDGDGLRDARELLYTHTDPLVADAPADRFDAVLDSSVHEIQPAPAHQPAHDAAHDPGHDAAHDPAHGDPGHGHADPAHPGGTTAPGLTLEHPLLDSSHDPLHGPDQHGQDHHDQHGHAGDQHGQHGHDGHGGGHGW